MALVDKYLQIFLLNCWNIKHISLRKYPLAHHSAHFHRRAFDRDFIHSEAGKNKFSLDFSLARAIANIFAFATAKTQYHRREVGGF